jgi:hypothetical protein
MIEDVPVVLNLNHTSVVVWTISHGHICGLVSINMHITVADKHTAVYEILSGILTGCVAKLVHYFGRINKVIGVSYLTDGRCLEKCVLFKAGTCRIFITGYYENRLFYDGKHVGTKYGSHSTMSGLVASATETGIKISLVTLCQHAGVKLRLIPGSVTQTGTVLIMYITVEFITTCRCITYGYGYYGNMIQNIIQIISAVRTDGYVRCVKAHLAVFVQRVLVTGINHTFITPVAQIIHRCRPAYIVTHTEYITIVKIVGTIYVHSVAKYIRFSVGNILP